MLNFVLVVGIFIGAGLVMTGIGYLNYLDTDSAAWDTGPVDYVIGFCVCLVGVLIAVGCGAAL